MAIPNTENIIIHPKDDFGDTFNPKLYLGYFTYVRNLIITCDVSCGSTTIEVKL